MRGLAAIVLSALVAPASSLCGQAAVHLDSAARVRLTAPARGLRAQVGTVVAHHSDTLWVRTLPASETLAVPVTALTRVELSRGRHGHALRGAGIGFVSGAVVGAALGYAFPSDPSDCGFAVPCGREMDAAAGAFLGSLVGALTGAIVGANHRTEQWQLVIAPPLPATTSAHWPATRRSGIALHYAF